MEAYKSEAVEKWAKAMDLRVEIAVDFQENRDSPWEKIGNYLSMKNEAEKIDSNRRKHYRLVSSSDCNHF